MSDLSPSAPDVANSLAALLASDVSPQEFTRQLFNLDYERTKASDPILAEMLRACAIPRTFNAEIIGVLRDAGDEVATNLRLLADLIDFSFVLPVPTSGDYTYHDNTRQLLWDEWQQDEQRVQFEQLKTRLVTFYRMRGESAYNQKTYEDALAHFNRAIELQDKDGELYYGRGRIQLKLGAYQSALADLEQAIALQVNSSEVYFRLGAAHYYLQDYSACTVDFTKVIDLDPFDATAYSNRGNTYYNQKEYAKALSDYTEAIRLNPHYATPYYNRGNAYDDLEEYAKALSDYTEAIRLNPQDASAYNNRGTTYKNLERYEQALADYNEVIRLNPQDATAFYNCSCVYALQDQPGQALHELRRALELEQAAGSTEHVTLARSDADFDPIRAKPAFQALLAEFSP